MRPPKRKNEWSLDRFALLLINLVRVVVLINSSISVEIIIQLFWATALNGKSYWSKSHENNKQNLSLEERRVSDIKEQALNVNQATIQDTRD